MFGRFSASTRKRKTHAERRVSPLLLRILAVNIVPLAILVGGLLYLGSYQDKIIATELKEMLAQARLAAGAVSETAVVVDRLGQPILAPLLGRMMVRRLADATENRTRLYSTTHTLLADSRYMAVRRIRPPEEPALDREGWGARSIAAFFDALDLIHERRLYPLYDESAFKKDSFFSVATRALYGQNTTQVWRASEGGLILAAAVPVVHGRHVLGLVMMSRSDVSIDQALYGVRINILGLFLLALAATILLSLYLGRALARPIRQLAQAAEVLWRGQATRTGRGEIVRFLHDEALPDMTARNDEIGDLSGVLRAMTEALAARIDAIENFAADVAHELKNPLTSLRSAVETAERVRDPAAREKMMAIIRDDVDRMTRLISDIANASRLDAELERAGFEPVNLNDVLKGMARPRLTLRLPEKTLTVMGMESRLRQVFLNVLDNAFSFSPSDADVVLEAFRQGDRVRIAVDDNGPGIPENKRDAIFDRFYTERPKAEKFGMHSGLGLSISKQIVEAHQGRLWAENRRNEAGRVVGARFIVILPILKAR